VKFCHYATTWMELEDDTVLSKISRAQKVKYHGPQYMQKQNLTSKKLRIEQWLPYHGEGRKRTRGIEKGGLISTGVQLERRITSKIL
jgi:hypothetical protein